MPQKLSSPLPSPHEVLRNDLCDQILAAGGAKLVLIRGGAGFGKTTLMRQLRQRCESQALASVWLTLDSADNDIGRFLGGLALALTPLIPDLSIDAVDVAHDSGRVMLELVDRLARLSEPFILFLDDVEAVHISSILALIQQIIVALPLGSQVIAGSRSNPELGLGRLRARGWLLEIGPGELCFTLEETGKYVRERRLAVRGDDLHLLHARTEGWPVALWLASLALDKRGAPGNFIAGFSGNHTALAEYLTEDVLDRQAPEIRQFLLDTSILDTLTVPLCDHIRSSGDSRALLARLERGNLFLIPLDDEGASSRYHALFVQFLRSRLERDHPEAFRSLHRRASDYFLNQQRHVLAINHALKSGDREYALQLLSAHAEKLLSNARMRLLAQWLGEIPKEDLLPYPQLRIAHVWVVNFTRGPRAALALLDDNGDLDMSDSETRALSLPVRPMLLSLCDQNEEARSLGLENLKKMPPDARFPRSMLNVTLAIACIVAGQFAEARRHVDATRSTEGNAQDGFAFALTEALEGLMDLLRGDVLQASQRLRSLIQPRTIDPGEPNKVNAMAGILLAEALYELDDCAGAERLLNAYLPFVGGGAMPDQLIGSYTLLSRIHALRGDSERAMQLLSELEFAGHRLELRRVVLSARLERARCLLGQGKMEAAKDELEAAEDPLWREIASRSLIANDVEIHAIGRLRWMLRSGQSEQALPMLTELARQAAHDHRFRRLLKLKVLTAEALSRLREGRLAMRHLSEALTMAAPEGCVRVFADEGVVIAGMIREWRQGRAAGVIDPAGPISDSFSNRLLEAVGVTDSALGNETAGRIQGPAEPLTRKEVEVLVLTAEGLSNRALAERLFISEATIRTHLRNINSKLGVNNRVHAIALARRYGILT